MGKCAVGLVFVLTLLAAGNVAAAIDAYPFPNDELQQRYDALIDELRCPQCLNTNLAGSDAMIAQDLRREVHRMLLAGKSDEEILTFMYERYGDFILYRPRMSAATAMLWFGPVLFLLLAAIVMFRLMRRPAETSALSDEEAGRVAALLAESEKS